MLCRQLVRCYKSMEDKYCTLQIGRRLLPQSTVDQQLSRYWAQCKAMQQDVGYISACVKKKQRRVCASIPPASRLSLTIDNLKICRQYFLTVMFCVHGCLRHIYNRRARLFLSNDHSKTSILASLHMGTTTNNPICLTVPETGIYFCRWMAYGSTFIFLPLAPKDTSLAQQFM